MRWLAWIFGVLVMMPVMALVGWVGVAWLHAEWTQVDRRFRLAIEIDTPEGPRAGSSVIRVTRRDHGWMPLVGISTTPYEHRVEGEAVFVALPAGKSVIALLAHGPTGQDSDRMISLWSEAYLGWNGRWDEDLWSGGRKLEGVAELQIPQIPTLISFTDINDPASAKVVYAGGMRRLEPRPGESWTRTEPAVLIDEIAASFGPDYAFRRATIEMVPKGTPATRGIEKRLPWWGGPFPWLKPLGGSSSSYVDTRPQDQFRWNKYHLKRDG
jgi:hypothetical protein